MRNFYRKIVKIANAACSPTADTHEEFLIVHLIVDGWAYVAEKCPLRSL